jgi:hypothetical protein
MSSEVGCSDCIGSVEHASEKDEAVMISHISFPVSPHKGIGSVSRSASVARKSSTDNDGDETTKDDEENADAGCHYLVEDEDGNAERIKW